MSLILMIEDDEDNRQICRAILEHNGYEVREARDGKTGYAAARACRPALILLDIGLPVLDGWGVAKALKGDPLTADIPIVALTAHAHQRDHDMAEELGFTKFVSKPVMPTAVAETVRELIGPATP